MVTHEPRLPGPAPFPQASPPPAPPRGVVVPFGWLAGVADTALLIGLVRAGIDPVAAGLITTGILVIPWLVMKAHRG